MASLIRNDPAQRVLSIPDGLSGLVACALVAISFAYLRTELTYDEAVYLRLARTIAERGLPLRRTYEDFNRFQLFENSPPLVLYVTSISQRVFRGDEVPARLVHIAVFVLPTFVIVWWVARAKFGPWAGLASLIAMLTSGSYMSAASHVLLDIPLGLLACVALLAFYEVSISSTRRLPWLLAVALATALAVWTKYQAVCIAASIVAYAMYSVVSRGYDGLRQMFLPLSAMVTGGGAAVLLLIAFFWWFGGRDALTATWARNGERMSAATSSTWGTVRGFVETARLCDEALGAALLLLGVFAACAVYRHRNLLVLLASYVAITIAFNVTLFRLPGAGASYLDSAVPVLALLAGPGAVRLVELATTTSARALLALTVIAIQVASAASRYQPPRPNGSRVAAAYISVNGPQRAGVMAETVAIEFYADRPVRPASFTYPRELVLRSLEGTSGDDISFVVVDADAIPKNLGDMQQQWKALLSKHFGLVSAGAPGLQVYRRTPAR